MTCVTAIRGVDKLSRGVISVLVSHYCAKRRGQENSEIYAVIFRATLGALDKQYLVPIKPVKRDSSHTVQMAQIRREYSHGASGSEKCAAPTRKAIT